MDGKVINLLKEKDKEKEEEIPEGFTNTIPEIVYENENDIPLNNKRFATHSNTTIQELMGGPKPDEDDVFVIIQDGGTGDAICATPMIASARKKYKDKTLIVASSHPEVLENNPDIDHLYHLGAPDDLFEKWVKPLKHYGSIFKRDIYNSCSHKLFPGPLSMIFCHLYGVPFEGDNIKMYITEKEDIEAKKFLKSFKERKDKVIVIHPYGGRLTWNGAEITPNKNWFDDYWVDLLKNLSNDFDIIQVGGKDEPQLPYVATYLMGQTTLRQTAALLKNCLTYVSIDSFVNHCGPAVGKRGIVLFGRSNPYIAGHAMNRNLSVKGSCEENDFACGRPMGYFGDSEMYKGVGRPWVCPHRSCMKALNPIIVYNEVIDLIKNLIK